MSSPFSMLKKTKRSPLQGSPHDQWDKQKLALRRNLQQEFEEDLAANDSSDPALHSSLSGKDPFTSRPKMSLNKVERCQPGLPGSDSEVTSAMIQRVALLEKTVKTQAQETERLGKIISILEEKLRAQEESVKTHCSRDREDLERRLKQLQNQVYEMETFLGDCALVSAENEDSSDVWQPGTSADRSFRVDFDLVLQRIKDLNIVTGEGECFVQTTLTGAKLAKKDPIPLRLYSNGMMMFDGPFRSYQEPSTQQCMQDLMDGYFPSELQQRFPDGIPFEAHDRRHEEFVIRRPWDTFPGKGQALLREKDESWNAVSSQLQGKNLSTERFLNKLQKVVVEADKMIDIRDSLRTLLQGSSDTQSSSSILINTPALQAEDERKQTHTEKRPPANASIKLKVKSEEGNRTYMMKMCLSETVGDLRNHLDKHRGTVLPGYDIISVLPKRCFSDDSQTLQSCGLLANTTLLLLRKTQQSQPLMEVYKLT
ncbi:UBX domain-containing protein 11 [Cololabis saira]|uniref:UBX domain-containing protein 11 n=1 Tax=Cololabis saira TaxID=129043 RepID=UPI002AD4AA1D|nr:UBX domain-containing protein 11 [Cololabis saira]